MVVPGVQEAWQWDHVLDPLKLYYWCRGSPTVGSPFTGKKQTPAAESPLRWGTRSWETAAAATFQLQGAPQTPRVGAAALSSESQWHTTHPWDWEIPVEHLQGWEIAAAAWEPRIRLPLHQQKDIMGSNALSTLSCLLSCMHSIRSHFSFTCTCRGVLSILAS